MTQLLVSVRSLDEALLAATAGVDLIDVKEPTGGPLGMADAAVRREIGQHLGAENKLSAACGELRDFVARSVSEGDKIDDTAFDSDDSAAWAGYRFAKIGLAGCAEVSNWRESWLAWRAALPSAVEPVLVCYADGERCDAPGYDELRAFAREVKAATILFDTWDKSGPALCQLWQAADFLRVGQELRRDSIAFVLAGKLSIENVPDLNDCGASYLGIRGAVCDFVPSNGDRRCGKLNTAKIKSWQQALQVVASNTAHPSASNDA